MAACHFPMTNLKIAITDFVGFLCRKGDLSTEFTSSVSGVEGTKLHQLIQKTRREDYQSEVFLSISHPFEEDVELVLSGRADGIFERNQEWYIEEIKSTTHDLSTQQKNEIHLAQAKLYAYIYALDNQLETIHIQLTYIHLQTKEEKNFIECYPFSELEAFYNNSLNLFYQFYKLATQKKKQRNESIQKMTFPYPAFRKGQKEMSISCFKAIKNNEVLLIQAPTGIGKTLSTLYPAIQALGKYTSKVMYLTAKTVTSQVAVETLELMKSKGLSIDYLVLTAKEKICFLDESHCHPDFCKFASGHYDRINEALLDILSTQQTFTRPVIEIYAKKHQVCPFELSLDLFHFVDVSISDYNYAFDPKVNLKRAFETKNDYVLLVDEAHNLVDRSMQMYSATIDIQTLQRIKKKFKPKKGKLYRSLKKIVDLLEAIQDANIIKEKELNLPLLHAVEHFLNIAKEFIVVMEPSEFKDSLIQVFFMLNDFKRITEYYDDHFISYCENHTYKLFCLDASDCLRPIYKKSGSVILFSATLLPISYFFGLLGAKKGDQKLYFESPFPKEHQLVLVANDIHATYTKRHQSYDDIVKYIDSLVAHKQGHYLIFFPSYAYLNAVASKITTHDVYIQKSDMNEQERETFLKEFEKDQEKTKLFFCVLGGIFSEGIDLKGNQVIGVVIVSVGLPQICLERELINENLGFQYAYTYPGFNKVLQAAGRLIRTMEDVGVVLLLDKRYSQKEYLTLFPSEWHHAKKTNLLQIGHQLDEFYNSH